MYLRILLSLVAAVLCFPCLGCGGGKSEPIKPKVDLTKKRVPFRVKEEDLNFPQGFPKEIKLLKPTVIYEQDVPPDMITWDTDVAVKEARDHYLAEFERLGFKTSVETPKGMAGENYIIQATNDKDEKCFCVGLGCAREEEQVKCFIYALEAPVHQKEKQSPKEKKTSGQ